MLDYLTTLPAFLIYLGVASALLLGFMIAYVLLTPQREMPLIRQGNVSASVVFGSTVLGFALPLASAVAHSVSPLDLALWGAIACVVQAVASLICEWRSATCVRTLKPIVLPLPSPWPA